MVAPVGGTLWFRPDVLDGSFQDAISVLVILHALGAVVSAPRRLPRCISLRVPVRLAPSCLSPCRSVALLCPSAVRASRSPGPRRSYSLRRGGACHDFLVHRSFDLSCERGRWRNASTARVYLDESLAQHARLSVDFVLPTLELVSSWWSQKVSPSGSARMC